MAKLKSFFTFQVQDVSNSTEPNCLPGGPHKTTSPCLRLIAFIACFAVDLFFPWHAASVSIKKLNLTRGISCSKFFILA